MAEFDPIPLSRPSEAVFSEKPAPVEFDGDGLHLFIDNPRVAELPENFCITFRGKRGPLTLRESGRGRPGSASADLTLVEICDVKEDDYEKPKVAEAKDVVDDIFESIRKEQGDERLDGDDNE
jgi:hypothetical protein